LSGHILLCRLCCIMTTTYILMHTVMTVMTLYFLCRLYCVLETFLVLWALGLALDAIFPCLLGDAVSKASSLSPSSIHLLMLLQGKLHL